MQVDDGDDMTDDHPDALRFASRQRFLQSTAAVGLGAGAVTTETSTVYEQSDEGQNGDGQQGGNGQLPTEIMENASRLFSWLLPGRHRLRNEMFGTSENPCRSSNRVQEARQRVAGRRTSAHNRNFNDNDRK